MSTFDCRFQRAQHKKKEIKGYKIMLNTSHCTAQLLSWVELFTTPWTVACPPSMEFFRQEYWSGLSFHPPGDLPDPETEPMSSASPTLAGRLFTTEPPGT